MKKKMKLIISLMMAVVLLALMGCRNDTNTASPEPTLNHGSTQDTNASMAPVETEKPEESGKPGQPFYASLEGPRFDFSEEEKHLYIDNLNEHDLNAIRTFLEIEDDYGFSNGEKMNEWYSPDDPTTWFYTPEHSRDYYLCEGYRGYNSLAEWENGRVVSIIIEPIIQRVDSPFNSLLGELDFSYCEELRYMKISENNLGPVLLEGCAGLTEIVIKDSLGLEQIGVDGVDLEKLKITSDEIAGLPPINCAIYNGTGLGDISWYCTLHMNEGGNPFFGLIVDTAADFGTFNVETVVNEEECYTCLVAVPMEGHRFIGWYDSQDNLVSTDERFMFVDLSADEIEYDSDSNDYPVFYYHALFE